VTKNNKDGKFQLFANCIPVNGITKSVICDIQRGTLYNIPNALYDILTNHGKESIGKIKSKFNRENATIIDEYFSFMEEHELGFWTNIPNLFPALSMKWKSPNSVTNALIDNIDLHYCPRSPQNMILPSMKRY
jgi:hypothetical protein